MLTKNLSLHAKKIRSENVCLRTKFHLRVKKKKILGKFSKLLGKVFVSYMEIVWSAFFSKKIKISFFLSSVCSNVLKKPQKWFNFVSIVFRKCMKIVWQAFSPYTWWMELYDNHFCCMELYVYGSIFSVWRSTRVASFNYIKLEEVFPNSNPVLSWKTVLVKKCVILWVHSFLNVTKNTVKVLFWKTEIWLEKNHHERK